MKKKRQELYYLMLLRAGSFWGRLVGKEIIGNRSHSEVSSIIGTFEELRNKYKSQDHESKANLQLFDTFSPTLIGFIRWFLVPNLLTLCATFICTAILYLPLHFINIQPKWGTATPVATEPFVVTEDFLEASLEAVQEEVDTTSTSVRPTAPTDFRFIN